MYDTPIAVTGTVLTDLTTKETPTGTKTTFRVVATVVDVVACTAISSFCWLMRFVRSAARVASILKPRISGCTRSKLRDELSSGLKVEKLPFEVWRAASQPTARLAHHVRSVSSKDCKNSSRFPNGSSA